MSRTAPLACVFLLSGACAIIFETLWFHQAALVLGDTVLAASIVLSAFMVGMAIGNWIAARQADRIRHAIRAYAWLEVAIAVFGVALVWGMPVLASMFTSLAQLVEARPALMSVMRFASAFALLLLPSAAMGMSLPLLVRAAGAWEPNFGRALGLLYGANTLGAVCGGIASELWLVEAFGILGSALCAGALNLLAALLALWLSRARAQLAQAEPPAAISGRRRAPLGATAALLCAAGFVSGALLLSLEVVWLRVLVLLLNDTSLAFAMILALVLSGIAAGSFSASLCVTRWARAADYAWLVAYAAGLSGLAGYWAYPKLLLGAFPAYQPAHTIAAIAAPLVVPTSFASGALFTLLGARLRVFSASDGEAAGRLGLANTLGAGLGPLLATFVLLPQLGMERSLLCLLGAYGVIALVLSYGAGGREPRSLRSGSRSRRCDEGQSSATRLRHAGALLFVAALVLFPHGRIQAWYIRISAQRWMHDESELVRVQQGVTATLLHIVHRKHGVPTFDQIATNAYSMTANGFFGRRYMKSCVYLPAALHPGLKRALVVGFGIGNTAKALTDMKELERIDIVDVSRDMLDASRRLRVPRGSSALDDPRVHVHIEDGRFFLQTTKQQYDLITGEPPPPIIAGVVNLYTTEYFRLVRNRLAPGGYATHWLPVMNISAAATRSLIRGFCDAFADCSLWHGAASNLMLMGSRDARGPVSAERFSQAWHTPLIQPELSALGFEVPEQLGAQFIGDAAYLRASLGDSPPLTDDRPKRLQPFVGEQEFAPLVELWRDEAAAHARFQSSAWVASLWPPAYRKQNLALFEIQGLLDQLMSGEPTSLRTTKTLHPMLFRTRLRLPVLLLTDSDPDTQEAIARLPPEQRERPEWLVQRASGKLADRDLPGALNLLSQIESEEELPLPDLGEYLDYAVRRESARTTP